MKFGAALLAVLAVFAASSSESDRDEGRNATRCKACRACPTAPPACQGPSPRAGARCGRNTLSCAPHTISAALPDRPRAVLWWCSSHVPHVAATPADASPLEHSPAPAGAQLDFDEVGGYEWDSVVDLVVGKNDTAGLEDLVISNNLVEFVAGGCWVQGAGVGACS